MPTGAYKVWSVTAGAAPVPDWRTQGAQPDPSSPKAVDIYFGVVPTSPSVPPPRDQADLLLAISAALGTVQHLYGDLKNTPENHNPKFRSFYMRLFRLAQLGLEETCFPDVATEALDHVVSDIVDGEAERVKNDHLKRLGEMAAQFGALCLSLYLIVSILPPEFGLLRRLNIEPRALKSFMLLWTGSFCGVWLSYAIRSVKFTLRDLTVSDEDRLLPAIRLIFAGLLTMILGIVFDLGLAEVKLGGVSLTDFVRDPEHAFLLGAMLGISELALPSVLARRAATYIEALK